VLAWSENVINFVLLLPAGAIPGTYTATVHRGNGKTTSGSFTVGIRDSSGKCLNQAPVLTPPSTEQLTITGASCASSAEAALTITGTGFGTTQGGGSITLTGPFANAHGNQMTNTLTLTVLAWSDTAITAQLPPPLFRKAVAAVSSGFLVGDAAYTLMVQRDNGQSASATLVPETACPGLFGMMPPPSTAGPPSISGLTFTNDFGLGTLSTGCLGMGTLTITGTGFGANEGAGFVTISRSFPQVITDAQGRVVVQGPDRPDLIKAGSPVVLQFPLGVFSWSNNSITVVMTRPPGTNVDLLAAPSEGDPGGETIAVLRVPNPTGNGFVLIPTASSAPQDESSNNAPGTFTVHLGNGQTASGTAVVLTACAG
jgi:hypothetical protein